MKIKTISGILALLIAMMVTAGSVHAQELVESTPSRADDITVGEDVTQGKVTEYADPQTITGTTYESDNVVHVYATATSEVVVKIPLSVIIGKTEEKGVYAGGYTAEVSGDIAGSQKIILTPVITVKMTESGGKNNDAVTGSATINGKESLTVTANDLLSGNVHAVGEMTASGITAGRWSCEVNFHVAVVNE